MFNATSPSSIAYQLNQRKQQDNKFLGGDVFAQIKSVSSSSEEVVTNGVPTKITITHPFLSVSSWDRAIPEQGAVISACYNKEAGLPLMTMYRNIQPSELISKYNSGSSLYKELSQGELDRMSSGFANTFHANRPLIYNRAGLVEQILNGDEMTLFERSPTYVWQMHQHKVSTLDDEMRLGVVRRYKNPLEKKIIKNSVMEGGLGFAKEHTLVLVNKLGKLIDRREGNVCDDMGMFLMHPTTGFNLRYRELIYTILQHYHSKIIDFNGNCKIEYPVEATDGLDINIPMGRFQLKTGRDINVTAMDKVNISTSMTMSIESLLDSKIEASGTSTMSVAGFLTKLGIRKESDVAHPLVFGDTLVEKLINFLIKVATHTHPSVPPSPEFSTACIELANALPSCVSKNVVTK